LKSLSPKDKQAIKDAVTIASHREFPPGSGMTYEKRVARIEAQHREQIKKLLSRKYSGGNAQEKILQEIRNGLTGKGTVPTQGGSLMNKLRRLAVAEESRMANIAEIRIMELTGMEFAAWRLNPSHKWYGGQEICEHLAYVTNPDVVSRLSSLGVDPGMELLEGIHLVSQWPQHPHPYCKCYPEAWYPESLRASSSSRRK